MRKVGASAGLAGALLTLVAGALHPKGSSDVGTVAEWMTRVGNSDVWIPDHLLLLVGSLLLLVASVTIAHSFRDERARAWAEAAWTVNVVATAIAVVTFLFDGAVVKNVAEQWQAHPEDPSTLGAAQLATETGFILVAGLQLTTGAVALLFAAAGFTEPRYPRWLMGVVLAGGLAGVIPGAAHYLAGSSTITVSLVYVSSALVAIWFLLASWRLWTDPRPEVEGAAA
jgi:hypothetical protein